MYCSNLRCDGQYFEEIFSLSLISWGEKVETRFKLLVNSR